MSEILLNLSKMLETLFPADKDAGTIAAARLGLRAYGYSEPEVEAKFIPAMALRSHLDVAHVFLSNLDTPALSVLHDYTDHAEYQFRDLLLRIADAIQRNDTNIPQYEPRNRSSREVEKIIAQLAKRGPRR